MMDNKEKVNNLREEKTEVSEKRNIERGKIKREKNNRDGDSRVGEIERG
jgi:hypothetical protein